MLVYTLLPEITYYIESGYGKDFSEQLARARSEILEKLTCILSKDAKSTEIIKELKEVRRFRYTVNNSYELIKLISSSEGINVLSISNIVSLLITVSVLTILNFYISRDITIFEQQMTTLKNCIFNCKLELPMFNDFICSKFNSIFYNLAKLENTIVEAHNKIMREDFNMQHKKQCIQDFMLHIEVPLKELYDGIIDCLLEKQEAILKDVTLLITHINDYFKWFIGKVKETVRYLIARYNGIAAEQAIQNQDSFISLDSELDANYGGESGCSIIASWLSTKWELWFYNRKQQEPQQPVEEPPLKGNSFNEIIRQRAASRPTITR